MLMKVTIDGRASKVPGPDEPAFVNSRFLVSISEEFLKAPNFELARIPVRRLILSVGAQSMEIYVKETVDYFERYTRSE